MADTRPIGVFDSGVGGLSVLRHLVRELPAENVIYIADQAHIPYGRKSAETIRCYSQAITAYLLAQECKLIVVACNTATAAAISHLRAAYPQTAFVGMEPAVKPGAAATQSGCVGILATAGTFESQKYASLMERYASDVVVLQDACVGLVELIEAGDWAATEPLLERVLAPMLAASADTLVLGCTHYPFVREQIERIAARSGQCVTLIDPAPAIARQARRILAQQEQLASRPTGTVSLLTTGDAQQFATQNKKLMGWHLSVKQMHIICV